MMIIIVTPPSIPVNANSPMNFLEIRRTVIIAMFSDDVLMDQLVLKGGNALNIVHGLGTRTSIDIDLSMPGDFADPADASRRIERALRDRFDSQGFSLFDYRFEQRPRRETERRGEGWGGYRVEFKLQPFSTAIAASDLSRARRSALEVSPGQTRVFRVDISKHEYCDDKVAATLDDYEIYVYPPFLLAAEKARALCQQMPEYGGRRKVTARARDFYDIHAIVSDKSFVLPRNFMEVLSRVFAAKNVPLSLLDLLPAAREFHRTDWPSVVDAVGGVAEPFDFYFEYVNEWLKTVRGSSE